MAELPPMTLAGEPAMEGTPLKFLANGPKRARSTHLSTAPPDREQPRAPQSFWSDPKPGLAACGLLLAALYYPALREIAAHWSKDPNYSHGFCVPPLSLYFAWEASKLPAGRRRGGLLSGLVVLVLALLVYLGAALITSPLFYTFSIMLCLSGCLLVLGGWSLLRQYAFPVFFLAFMAPLPNVLYTRIAFPLQQIVTTISVDLLRLMGYPVIQEGNRILLPGNNTAMFVAQACSGLRQLTGFLALSTAFAFLYRRPWWYKAALIVSALVIALLTNIVRVTVTGLIWMYWGEQYAEGTMHTYEGMAMMVLGLGVLFAEKWLLDLCIVEGPPAPTGAAGQG